MKFVLTKLSIFTEINKLIIVHYLPFIITYTHITQLRLSDRVRLCELFALTCIYFGELSALDKDTD